MSKSMDKKKETKKQPTKTVKEKRTEKKAKKEGKRFWAKGNLAGQIFKNHLFEAQSSIYWQNWIWANKQFVLIRRRAVSTFYG